MNNKKISSIVISILMVVILVYAQSLDNRNLTVSKDYKTALDSIGINNYNYTDMEQDGLYRRCLYKKDVINTCSNWLNISIKTLNEWELERIEGIAEATITRQNVEDINIETTGTVTVNQK